MIVRMVREATEELVAEGSWGDRPIPRTGEHIVIRNRGTYEVRQVAWTFCPNWGRLTQATLTLQTV